MPIPTHMWDSTTNSNHNFFISNIRLSNIRLSNIRLSKVRGLEIELSACDVVACADHPGKEWLVLEGIYNHLGSNLGEMIIRVFWCGFRGHVDGPDKDAKWIKGFAEKKRELGINICIVWALVDDNGFSGGAFDYYWPALTSDTNLLNLFRRTVWGLYPRIRIWGLPGLHIPNVLARLTNLLAGRFMPAKICEGLYHYFELETNIKLSKMDNLDDHWRCFTLQLQNKEAIEEEEVVTMEAILTNMAKIPRPLMPRTIILPKVKI